MFGMETMLGMVKKRRPALTIPLVILAVIGVLRCEGEGIGTLIYVSICLGYQCHTTRPRPKYRVLVTYFGGQRS